MMAKDTRKAGVEWQLPSDDQFRWEHVTVAVLMDIRDEIKALKHLLGCFRVIRGMDALHSIDRRLSKHLPHRKPKTRKHKARPAHQGGK